MSTRARVAALAGALVITASAAGGALASSHREAPQIAGDPAADNTDLYAFVSPDDPTKVTIIANYIPLEEPAGGPNFHLFDPAVRYELHIDNNGDARDDVTYRFRFRTHERSGQRNTFLAVCWLTVEPPRMRAGRASLCAMAFWMAFQSKP